MGTSPDTLDRVAALREAGVDVVVVDTSHGHSRGVLETVAKIKKKYPDIQVIGGPSAAPAAAAPLGGSATASAASASARTYTVKAGDTLSGIAKSQLGHANEYMKIFEANRDKLSDPNRIQPGQEFVIP